MTTSADQSEFRTSLAGSLTFNSNTLIPAQEANSTYDLAASITKSASKQTYLTIGYLVDHERKQDAYRAYAYFRWVDDWLDQSLSVKSERIAFVKRQSALVDACYRGEWPTDISPEERMLVDLVQNDPEPTGGLHSYIRNMLAVMAFDAHRRGSLITEDELAQYSGWLATAVTDALHYFIGHNDRAPQCKERYFAVTAAHISHMLRDTCDDVAAGYFNVPRKILEANGIDPCDLSSHPYRMWVKDRISLAREYFKFGKDYLARVENFRCRLAGYAYIARFESILAAIERDDYLLRSEYPECKGKTALLGMIMSVGINCLGISRNHRNTVLS